MWSRLESSPFMSKCHLKGLPNVVPELIRLTKKQVSFLLPGAQSSLAKLNLELLHPQGAQVTAGSGISASCSLLQSRDQQSSRVALSSGVLLAQLGRADLARCFSFCGAAALVEKEMGTIRWFHTCCLIISKGQDGLSRVTHSWLGFMLWHASCHLCLSPNSTAVPFPSRHWDLGNPCWQQELLGMADTGKEIMGERK